MKKNARYILLSVLLFFSVTNVWGKEIAIVFTGDTQAMLYPCNCPKAPDGGIARRAAYIKKLRKEKPHLILLDAGSFMGGGSTDDHVAGLKLDKNRSEVNVKAMAFMRYDAVLIGSSDFSFGKDFLVQRMLQSNTAFLSANLKIERARAFKIVDAQGIKIALVGLSAPAPEGEHVEYSDPLVVAKQVIKDARSKGAELVVVLSALGDSLDESLLKSVDGIDVLIKNGGYTTEEPVVRVRSTVVVKPNRQARKLDILTLEWEARGVKSFAKSAPRMSDAVVNDPDISGLLPPCFQDTDCKKQGSLGKCVDPEKSSWRCDYEKAAEVRVTILTALDCSFCNPQEVISQLSRIFPGLTVSYLAYPDPKGKALADELKVDWLPVFLFEKKQVENEQSLVAIKDKLEARGDYYMLKYEFGGMSYFTGTQRVKGAFDIFFSLYDKGTEQLIEGVRDFNPGVHFLAAETPDGFDAARGPLEAEECLRSVCVQKYFPHLFWDYMSCRAKNSASSWWEDCAGSMDTFKIKLCAKGEEGKNLLRENIRLNKEIGIMFGPAYLVERKDLFSMFGPPKKEELKKILKR